MHDAEIRTLLADLGWLRALARRLARDASAADDVVQEACAIALERPRPPHQWRAWLTGVVKNLVHERRRQQALDRRCAEIAAVAESRPTDDVVHRAEMQHTIATQVLALEEPYRSTVLLRFFDALPPRRIAAMHGVPVATVHSRLQRAMQMLRRRLDRESGSRSKWLAVVIPIGWPSSALRRATALRARQFAFGGVALAVAAFGAWTFCAGSGASSPSAPGSRANAVVATTSERVAVTDPAPIPPAPRPRPVDGTLVRGRVVDVLGHGLAGVRVSARTGDYWSRTDAAGTFVADFARTDSDGSFAGRLEATHALLIVRQPELQTIFVGTWSTAADVEPCVVVAPGTAVVGTVVDAEGHPVGHGEVALRLPPGVLAGFEGTLDASSQTAYETRVGADGSFAIAGLPWIEGAELVVTGDGCDAATVPLPRSPTADLRIVLAAPVAGPGDLQGDVLHVDGSPAHGALVALGVTSVTTDRRGHFVLRLLRAGRPSDLVAALPGFAPARLAAPAEGGDVVEDWPRPIELRLGPPCGKVVGRVVDEHGPVAGAEVWIDDPTRFGAVRGQPVQLEYFVAGGALRCRGRPIPLLDAATVDDPAIDDRQVPAQFAHEDEPTASWFFVTTDGEGRFTLPGLLDRPAALRAFDPATARTARVVDVIAGGAPEIRLVEAANVVLGRVLAPNGDPLAGVRVRQEIAVFARRTAVPAGAFQLGFLREGRTATTAADGTFALPVATALPWFLGFDGQHIRPGDFDGAEVRLGAESTFVLERRCRFVIALADPSEADAVSFADRDGRTMHLMAPALRNARGSEPRLPLRDGRSVPIVVGESVATCVLWRGEVRVRSFPVSPTPGGVTTVR